jgi:hypothetical protein
MTIAGIRKSIREIETAMMGSIAGKLIEMPLSDFVAYQQWRAHMQAWHAAHPNAYEDWLDGGCEPPSPPPGLFQPVPVLSIGDNAADVYRRMVEGDRI